MSKKQCPACGSEALIEKNEKQVLSEPFGGKDEIDLKSYFCETCESTGDFFNENEELIKLKTEQLKIRAIKNILEQFSTQKMSMSGIERALSIPQRTLTKWKNEVNTPNATGLALMKFLATFPWLLDVAENDFDYNIAQKIHIEEALVKLVNSLNFNKDDFLKAGVIATTQSTLIFLQLKSSTESVPVGSTNVEITKLSNSEDDLLKLAGETL